MVAAEIKTLAAIRDGAHQDSLVRAEIIAGIGLGQLAVNVALNRDQIENGGGEITNLTPGLTRYITSHGQRLEIHLRGHDRRAEAQHHAAFEVLYRSRED